MNMDNIDNIDNIDMNIDNIDMNIDNIDINIDNIDMNINRGAIQALIHTGAMNKYFKNNKQTYYEMININSNIRHNINKNCDLIHIDKIIIPNNIKDFNIIDFNLEFILGGSRIFSIDKTMLFALSNIDYVDDKIIINIPHNIFIEQHIPLFLLRYHEFRIYLRSSENFKYEILLIKSILNNEIKQPYIDRDLSEYKIKQFELYCDNNNTKSIKIYHYILSGFFIKSNSKLKDLKIMINGYLFNHYDNFMLNHLGFAKIIKKYVFDNNHKIALYKSLNNILPNELIDIIYSYAIYNTEYIYWIPNEKNKEWYDLNTNYINCSKADVVINYETENNMPIMLYALKLNILRIISDMGGLVYLF
jgi:hypothetical protein